MVNPALPVKTLPELIKYAKDNPGKLSYASTGIGTVPHLAFEILKTMSGIDITHVPFSIGAGWCQALSDCSVDPVLMSLAGSSLLFGIGTGAFP